MQLLTPLVQMEQIVEIPHTEIFTAIQRQGRLTSQVAQGLSELH